MKEVKIIISPVITVSPIIKVNFDISPVIKIIVKVIKGGGSNRNPFGIRHRLA